MPAMLRDSSVRTIVVACVVFEVVWWIIWMVDRSLLWTFVS
jgi:hypothetical protein